MTTMHEHDGTCATDPLSDRVTTESVEAALVAAHQRSRAWDGAAYYVMCGDAPTAYHVMPKFIGDVILLAKELKFIAEVQANGDEEGAGPRSTRYPRHLTPADIERLERRQSDPGWAAALHILTFAPLATKAGIWRHVDPEHGIDFEAMLDDTSYMSGGEQRLIRIAASCYGADHAVGLQEVLSNLSEEWLERAIEAMRHAAGN